VRAAEQSALVQQRGRQGVVCVRVLAAPGVEGEVDQLDITVAGDRQRTVVAHPGVVGG
jgi:hypothetical protein